MWLLHLDLDRENYKCEKYKRFQKIKNLQYRPNWISKHFNEWPIKGYARVHVSPNDVKFIIRGWTWGSAQTDFHVTSELEQCRLVYADTTVWLPTTCDSLNQATKWCNLNFSSMVSTAVHVPFSESPCSFQLHQHSYFSIKIQIQLDGYRTEKGRKIQSTLTLKQ